MSIRFFLQDTFFYGGLSLLNRSVSLLLFPVLVRSLSKEEYAIVDSFTVLSGFLFVMLLLGIDSAVARFLADTKNDFEKKHLFTESVLCLIVNIITFIPIIYLLNSFLLDYYLGDSTYKFLFPLILSNLSIHLIIHNFLSLFKWMFEKFNYFLISFGHTTFTIFLTLYFLLMHEQGLLSVFYGQLISSFIFLIISLMIGKKYICYKLINFKIFRFYKFGFPIFLVSGLGCIIPIIERNFISHHLTLQDIAVFSVSLKIVLFLSLITSTFNTAWTPFALSIFKKDNALGIFNKIFVFILFSTGVLILLLNFFSDKLITFLAGVEYSQSVSLVLPLLLSRFFIFSSLFISIGVFIKKKNKYLILPKIIYIICFIMLAPLYIQKGGLVGFCNIVLICSIVSFIIHVIINIKISDYNFKYIYYIPFILLSIYTINIH